jgi:hypothetical protein
VKVRRKVGALALALGLSIGGLATAAGAAPVSKVVLAGQFCKTTDLGKVVKADNGKTVKCTTVNGYNRWVIK